LEDPPLHWQTNFHPLVVVFGIWAPFLVITKPFVISAAEWSYLWFVISFKTAWLRRLSSHCAKIFSAITFAWYRYTLPSSRKQSYSQVLSSRFSFLLPFWFPALSCAHLWTFAGTDSPLLLTKNSAPGFDHTFQICQPQAKGAASCPSIPSLPE
jgi:hypothetical protein